MKKSEKYKNLKRVVVIMIMQFDPFGHNHTISSYRKITRWWKREEMIREEGVEVGMEKGTFLDAMSGIK